MEEHNVATDEKVLVLGAGQLGAAVLDSLVPAVIQRNGAISVIVSPGSWDARENCAPRLIKNWPTGGGIYRRRRCIQYASLAKRPLCEFCYHHQLYGICRWGGYADKNYPGGAGGRGETLFSRQFGVNYDAVGKGSGQPVWDEQYDVRTLLRAQTATEWVIISTGMFTSFLFEPAFDVVNLSQNTLNALGDGIRKSP